MSYPASGAQTPDIQIGGEPYVEDQPISSLLKSLQNAMNAATAIDTGTLSHPHL